MNSRFLKTAFAAAALLMLSSCSQDEIPGNDRLPEGKYPLEIASVTMDVQDYEQPWNAPRTRVSENSDRMGSHWDWDGTEQIGVQLYADGSVATYTLNTDKTLTPDKRLYWKNTQSTTVTAWYPAEAEVQLGDQNKLAYVLKGSGTGDFNNPITLAFTHTLAKVRVVLQGGAANKVDDVKIKSFTTCTHTKGTNIQGSNEGWITMQHVADKGYWEANVVPGVTITRFLINGTTEGTLNNGGITPQEAKVNTITLTTSLQPGEDGLFTINEGDDVAIEDYEGTAPIVVNGNATITLSNVKLNTNDNVITINNGATVTLNIEGTGNELTSTGGAGIKIMESINTGPGGSITINGTGASSSKLKVTAAGGVAIGFRMSGAHDTVYGGDIKIKNITLEAHGGFGSPAIGLSALENDEVDYPKIYGKISIDASTLVVSSTGGAACIGTPYHRSSSPFTLEGIYISNSAITATAESFIVEGVGEKRSAACIGFGYVYHHGRKIIKKIEFTNTTLHLTTDANYKVGFGDGNDSYQLTDGIWNNGSKVGDKGWNPQ